VKLHIGGYCSPLTTSSYNIHLARRRISSIQNYFMQYDNGVLRKYIVHTLGKPQLSFTEDVVGESKAAKGVSDNYYDTKNSIFNPGAAVERKAVIEVLGVE
jgi:hypothetical protein